MWDPTTWPKNKNEQNNDKNNKIILKRKEQKERRKKEYRKGLCQSRGEAWRIFRAAPSLAVQTVSFPNGAELLSTTVGFFLLLLFP